MFKNIYGKNPAERLGKGKWDKSEEARAESQ